MREKQVAAAIALWNKLEKEERARGKKEDGWETSVNLVFGGRERDVEYFYLSCNKVPSEMNYAIAERSIIGVSIGKLFSTGLTGIFDK